MSPNAGSRRTRRATAGAVSTLVPLLVAAMLTSCASEPATTTVSATAAGSGTSTVGAVATNSATGLAAETASGSAQPPAAGSAASSPAPASATAPALNPDGTSLATEGDLVDPSTLLSGGPTGGTGSKPPASTPPTSPPPASPSYRSPDLQAFLITGDNSLLARQAQLSQKLATAPDIATAATSVHGKNCTWSAWQPVAATAQATQCLDGTNTLYVLYYFSTPQDGELKDSIGRATVQAGNGNVVYVNSTGSYTIGISKQY